MDKELFTLALHISEPWYISDISFSPVDLRLDISIDFNAGSSFPCPVCGNGSYTAYDTVEKTWRHLNFFQYKCYIHCRTPRIKCETCGIHYANVPWSRKHSGFTLLMESMILLLASSMQMSEIAEVIGRTDHRIWRVIKHYVDKWRKHPDLSQVKSIGILL